MVNPLALAVLPDAQGALVVLTDGGARACAERWRVSLDTLRTLSFAAAQGERAARRALWDGLFPGAVGQNLRELLALENATPQGLRLGLQLPPMADALAWEWATPDDLGDTALSQHLPVLRHLLGVALPQPTPKLPQPSLLRVLVVGETLHRRATPWWASPSGAHPDSAGLRVHALTRADPQDDTVREMLGTHEVLVLDEAHAAGLVRVWPELPRPWALRLVVLTGAGVDERVRQQTVQAVVPCGVAVLDLGTVHGLEPLLAELLGGVSLCEAVQRVRGSTPGGTALRLYGPAEQAVFGGTHPVMAASLRQVTNLSYDLVGSTAWVERLGNERYTELLDRFHRVCTEVLHRHGATTRDPQGSDGAIAYFGHPQASENAAENAVAAGLALNTAVLALGVQLRVGITTGQVAVQHAQPVDESIHLADRLQKECARPGQTVVDELTRALVTHQFDVEPLGSQALTGVLHPVTAFRVLGRVHLKGLDAMASRPRLTPFVGREAEMLRLIALWEDAVRHRARVAWVRGEPGVGKSRLVLEFQRWLGLHGYQALVCQGHVGTRSSPFLALSEMLRRFFGLTPSDAPTSVRQKVALGLPTQGRNDDALDRLVALLGEATDTGDAMPETNAQVREHLMSTLVDAVVRAARLRPLCLVVEDAHWLDPSTREFLQRLFGLHGLALLVIATERTDESGAMAPPPGHEPLALHGLSPAQARVLALEACGPQPLPPAELRRLAARSDGVPLFVEESVQMALSARSGHAPPHDAHDARDARSPHELRTEVPSTLQALLMARLDALGDARLTAQLGAVLGREFDDALLRAVAARDAIPGAALRLSSDLARLQAAGLLHCQPGPGQPRWVFKHALVRDVAYQSLWARDRQRLHRHVAEVLGQHFPELVERQPELLARHLTEADQPLHALGQWERAARRAAHDSAHEEAIEHIDRALALLPQHPPGEARDRIELRCELLRASRYIAVDGYGAERVQRAYDRAAELCQTLNDTKVLMKIELGRHAWHFMRGDLTQALTLAETCAQRLAPDDDAMTRIQVRWSLAMTRYHMGVGTEAVRLMDDCLDDYRPTLHRPGAVQDPGVMCLCYSAWAQWELGHVNDAVSRVQRLLALAQALNHPFSQAEAHGFASSVHFFRGETQAALDHAERAIAIADEGGFSVWLAHALVMRGRLRCDLGQHEAGLGDMARGIALWQTSGAAVTLPMYWATQAEGLARAGRVYEGLALLDQSQALIERTGERYHLAEVHRVRGELLWQGGAAAEVATPHLSQALSVARAQGKHSFVLRAARGLARVWLTQGRQTEAHELLARALADLPEYGDTGDVASVKALMRGEHDNHTIQG